MANFRKPAVTVNRDPATLPATATGHIFSVSGGRIRLIALVGEVTTVIQTQACNLKVTATPTVGSAVDLCANLNVSALAVGTQLAMTGTAATALGATNGAIIYQASSWVVKEGYVDLITSATNTGAVKWSLVYEPLDQGATVSAV